jgi:lysophospholipase L1-like esterase
MSSSRRKARLQILGLVALAVAAVASVWIAMSPAGPPPVLDTVTQAYENGLSAPSPQPTASSTVKAPALLTFGPGTKTLFFGDSWTFGMTAVPVTQGFAYLTAEQLQLNATVMGGPGTGYLNPGPAKEGTYSERLNKVPANLNPDLVVVQGSINDGNISPIDLPNAVNQFIAQLRVKFPTAQVVLVGPAPNAIPMDPSVTRLDNYLGQVAANNSLNYISPVKGNWITAENVGTVIDAKTKHPTNAGHAVLASKTVDALNAIKAQ